MIGLTASNPNTPATRRERILRIVGYNPSLLLPLQDGRRSPQGQGGLATHRHPHVCAADGRVDMVVLMFQLNRL
jgi:hypothetical protein